MTIRTLTKSDMNKFALSAWGASRNADQVGNHNGYITKAELVAGLPPGKATNALVKVHAAALKSSGRTSAVSTGDFYVYSKSLLTEVRKAVDTKGNKDGKLSNSELKYLSPAARALVIYGEELTKPKIRVPAQPGPKPG